MPVSSAPSTAAWPAGQPEPRRSQPAGRRRWPTSRSGCPRRSGRPAARREQVAGQSAHPGPVLHRRAHPGRCRRRAHPATPATAASQHMLGDGQPHLGQVEHPPTLRARHRRVDQRPTTTSAGRRTVHHPLIGNCHLAQRAAGMPRLPARAAVGALPARTRRRLGIALTRGRLVAVARVLPDSTLQLRQSRGHHRQLLAQRRVTSLSSTVARSRSASRARSSPNSARNTRSGDTSAVPDRHRGRRGRRHPTTLPTSSHQHSAPGRGRRQHLAAGRRRSHRH